MKQPVVLPRSIAEPAIALGRANLGAAGRHAPQLHAQGRGVSSRTARMARQARDGARGGPRLEEAPDPTVFDHGIGEHHVEPRLGGEPKARLTVRVLRHRL